jgi:hypothetical protein
MDRAALHRLSQYTLPSTLLGFLATATIAGCLKPQQLRENNILTARIQAVLDSEHRKPFLSVATWNDHGHGTASRR